MMNYSLTVKELKGHGKPLSFLKALGHGMEMEGQGAANAGSYQCVMLAVHGPQVLLPKGYDVLKW